jgi:hypothetical protein
MARNDPIFARVDISLMFNPQYRKLSATQRCFYLTCYLSAVEARSERLPHSFDLEAIRDRAGTDTRTGRKCLEKCISIGLLNQDAEGRICVIGVKENHQKLVWNESEQASPYSPHTGNMRGEERDREPRGEAHLTQAAAEPGTDHGKNNLILHRPEQARKVELKDYRDFCKADLTSIACTITGEFSGPGAGFFSKNLKTLANRKGDAAACEIFREMLFQYWAEIKSLEQPDNIGAGLSMRIKQIMAKGK